MTEQPAYAAQPAWTLQKIAALVEGRLVGNADTAISGPAGLEEAEAGDLVFAETTRYLKTALDSPAAAVLTSPTVAETLTLTKPAVLVADPRLAFIQILEVFTPHLQTPPGVHLSAVVGRDPHFGQDVHIGPLAFVGDNVTLGDRVVLLAGARVGDSCVIGEDTILYPNVVLYPQVRVGKRCLLHAGCVIGADGFGYILIGDSLRKVPHLGVVEIGDDVEIGANTCIDRAKTGATIIGAGTKIDNLVHIAHNCRLGPSCVLVGQVGLAGSVTLGAGVVLAGQVGIKDHITIGNGARLAAQSGLMENVPDGETYFGSPARPYAQKMREIAATLQLPEYVRRIRALEKRLAALESKESPPLPPNEVREDGVARRSREPLSGDPGSRGD